MSLSELANELQRKQGEGSQQHNNFASHITDTYLSPYSYEEITDKKGKTTKRKVLDVRAKTEYPHVPSMAASHTLGAFLRSEFGASASVDFDNFLDNFSIDMLSKDRKSRQEASQIHIGNAMSQKVGVESDVISKLNSM